MSKQQIGAFASRILGVLAFIWALGSFQTSALALATLLWQPAGVNGYFIWYAVVPLLTFVVFIGCGVLLLLGADRVGAYLAGQGDSAKTSTDVTVENIQAAGFAVVGLLVLALAIPSLIQDLLTMILRSSIPVSMSRTVAQLITVCLQFLIGLGIFLGAGGLAALWRSLRQAGARAWRAYGFEETDDEEQ
jgi:hypothetical protein